MAIKQSDAFSSFWGSRNDLRSSMDAPDIERQEAREATEAQPPARPRLRSTRSLARRSRSLSTGGSSTSKSTSSAMSQ